MYRKPYIYAVALLCLLLLAAFSDAAPQCSICGKEISGGYYISAQSQVVCSECNSRYGACSGCGLVSRSLINVDDLRFCRNCYAELTRCSLCGEIITGGYTQYSELGINVCTECERTAPRCDICGVPSRDLTRVGHSMLCPQCLSGAQRCHVCGEALLDNYTFFEGNKQLKFCAECVSRYDPCSNCGAPSGPRGTALDDGRRLCPDCMREAFFDPRLVTPIKNSVLSYMSGGLGMTLKHSIEYSLKDKSFLDERSKEMKGDLNGLFYRKGDDYHIYVLYGLRKKDLIWVLAHEISHAWQAENTSGELSLLDLEGFAQWVAYNSLRHFGYDEYAGTMLSGDTNYSRGLRKMLDIETAGGTRAVFDYIRSK
jgi:hypothetical protein